MSRARRVSNASRGAIIVPQDLKPGERRPVVVCQHGPGRFPADVLDSEPNHQAYRYTKLFAARLAERGYAFLPDNPYRGEISFGCCNAKRIRWENPSSQSSSPSTTDPGVAFGASIRRCQAHPGSMVVVWR